MIRNWSTLAALHSVESMILDHQQVVAFKGCAEHTPTDRALAAVVVQGISICKHCTVESMIS